MSLRVIQGDCLTEMRKLPAESFHCVVTSPPYWGLRDYKLPSTTWPDGWVGVFGLEPTPELYLEHSVMIFREVHRVLRKDGTLWVNLGDSYATDAGQGKIPGGGAQGSRWARTQGETWQPNRAKQKGLKRGDLVGIPWRFALALQADGWYLRRDNIWFKPNPMPESVNGWRWERHRIKTKSGWTKETHPSAIGGSDKSRSHCFGTHDGQKPSENAADYVDCLGCDKCNPNGGLVLSKGNWRCTTAHEYVFQFSKSDSYFCDAEAGRETIKLESQKRYKYAYKAEGKRKQHIDIRHGDGFLTAPAGAIDPSRGRNRRLVWQIPTAPYKGAHFATFPPNLVRPIILAATPHLCCAACQDPYAPVIERGAPRREQQLACGSNAQGEYHGQAIKGFEGTGAENASDVKARILAGMVEKKVVGYRATCDCGCDEKSVASVLDPFGGSGTVGQVALEFGRAATLIELSASYVPLIHKRCSVTAGLSL